MNKNYCYKIKWSYVKIKPNNAYSKAKIEKFGFSPMMETIDEQDVWAEGWAKPIKIKYNTSIGDWIKTNIESIYTSEKGKDDSKWVKEIQDSGYEFEYDEEAKKFKMLENEKMKEDIEAQLCIMSTGNLKGVLFINVGGAIEFYQTDTLLECAPNTVNELLSSNIIYKKKF